MTRPAHNIIPYPQPQQDECLSSTVERHLRAYFAAHEDDLPASGLYERVLQEIERPLLSIVLEECHGNQLRAAELLGLNRNTLRKKIRALGLTAGRRKSSLRRGLHD
jgi:two-component system nitrogen regulation response regulator GlnG